MSDMKTLRALHQELTNYVEETGDKERLATMIELYKLPGITIPDDKYELICEIRHLLSSELALLAAISQICGKSAPAVEQTPMDQGIRILRIKLEEKRDLKYWWKSFWEVFFNPNERNHKLLHTIISTTILFSMIMTSLLGWLINF